MKKYFFILGIGFLFFGFTHPFHVSKCEIGFNESETAMQISLHVFIDDLELALENEYPKRLRIATRREADVADSIIVAYLNRHFILEGDSQVIDYQMIGKEASKDWAGLWCYLEAPLEQLPKKLNIRNSLFLDVFDDQQNLLTVKRNQNKKWDAMFFRSHVEEEIDLTDD